MIPPGTLATGVLAKSAQAIPVPSPERWRACRERRAELQAIGAGATNRFVKAVAIARTDRHGNGIDVMCVPEFTHAKIKRNVRTAMRRSIERRPGPPAAA